MKWWKFWKKKESRPRLNELSTSNIRIEALEGNRLRITATEDVWFRDGCSVELQMRFDPPVMTPGDLSYNVGRGS